jgi:hypothetical protein
MDSNSLDACGLRTHRPSRFASIISSTSMFVLQGAQTRGYSVVCPERTWIAKSPSQACVVRIIAPPAMSSPFVSGHMTPGNPMISPTDRWRCLLPPATAAYSWRHSEFGTVAPDVVPVARHVAPTASRDPPSRGMNNQAPPAAVDKKPYMCRLCGEPRKGHHCNVRYKEEETVTKEKEARRRKRMRPIPQ